MEFLNFLGHKEQSEWTIQGEEERGMGVREGR